MWSKSNGGPSGTIGPGGSSGPSGPNESAVAVAMKIIIVGNSSVGKTSVLSRFLGRHHAAHAAYGAAEHWHDGPTIGVDFGIKVVKVRGRPVKLQNIYNYDTAGQAMYRSIASAYFRKAVGPLDASPCSTSRTSSRSSSCRAGAVDP